MFDSILLNVRFAMALSIEFVSDSISSSSLLILQSNNCHSDQFLIPVKKHRYLISCVDLKKRRRPDLYLVSPP